MDFGGCEHFLTFFNFEVILKDFSPEGPRAQNQHSLTCRHRRSRIRRVNMFRAGMRRNTGNFCRSFRGSGKLRSGAWFASAGRITRLCAKT